MKFFQKGLFLIFLAIGYYGSLAQKIPSQPHLQYVQQFSPEWKNVQGKVDTIPIHRKDNQKIILFHAFVLDSIEANLSLFFLGIVGNCEVYLNKALIYKGQDKYGKLLVNLPYSHVKKINVVQVCLYPKDVSEQQFTGLFQNVYLVKVPPERASLTLPKYSSYQDTVALFYPYSYLYGLRNNKLLLHKQLKELKQLGISKVKFMLPPPEYAYNICDSLDIFIVDNTENSLHTFYFNTLPLEFKISVLEYASWYNDSYSKTKHYQRTYTADAYISPNISYNIKVNLWLLSCILIGYLVFLKISFRDIIGDFYDWFRRYRLIMEVVKNKRLIPSLWVSLLTLFQWMIVSAMFVYIITSQTFVEKPSINPSLYSLLHSNLIWIFLLWLIFIGIFGLIHVFFWAFISFVSQLYGKNKIFARAAEISLINHFPILYLMVAVLFVLPLSDYVLEYLSWFVFYMIILTWLIIRIYRLYRFGIKGLKLHDIVIILYLCGAEVLPYFLLGFYLFNF